ncbi:MAG: hypothetical protein ABEL04_06725 [Salinibacter sp.]|uniref:hypothetical protein n=1 Tax=Salinibacter sp. TaxID=2065818 RepID=UPI0035D502E9
MRRYELPPSSVNRILTVNTWHHIPNREAYAEHLAGRLTNGGSIWVIDFEKDAPMGPPKKHRLNPQAVVQELEAGGSRRVFATWACPTSTWWSAAPTSRRGPRRAMARGERAAPNKPGALM